MIENHSIICFAPNDFWAMNPSCTNHLMDRFTRKNKVLYINPFSSDILGERKNVSRRIGRKVKSIFKCFRKVRKNLYVFSPVFLPLQGNPIIDMVNNIALRFQLILACRLAGVSRPIIWVENPRAADMLDWFSAEAIVYHISDLFSKSRYVGNKEKLRRREEIVTGKSDLLFCVSKPLYQLKSACRGNVFYLPHGVDFDLFRQACAAEPLKELADIPKPIAGYYGTMTANNDIELLLYCARRLPNVSFVFAGQITSGDYSELQKLPNVYLLGELPYVKIPRLCAGFNVCMLQWKMTDWIRSCNPLKMMEYMASGKPIVSVPIQEVVDNYSDIISVAESKEQFCDAIDSELTNDSPERSNRRIEIARSHSWLSNIEEISERITEVINKNNPAKKMSVQCDAIET